MPSVLHVGCGPAPTRLHPLFDRSVWNEIRLDIDPAASPDVLSSITDMRAVEDESVDALFSSHNVEHLYPHEVPAALAEFRRVLKPDGFALVTCPDLQAVAALVAEGKLEDAAYMSPSGPIAPLDIMYGFRASMARGNLFMAHRTGFVAMTLGRYLQSAGFIQTLVQRQVPQFALWALAFKTEPSAERLKDVATKALPYPVVVREVPNAG